MSDKDIFKKSYNKYTKKYRILQIEKSNGIDDILFMDKSFALLIIRDNNLKNTPLHTFELKPYKPYFLFLLQWSIKSLIDKIVVIKIKKFKAWSLLEKITLLISSLTGLIAIYEFIIKPNI